VDTLKI